MFLLLPLISPVILLTYNLNVRWYQGERSAPTPMQTAVGLTVK
jgi:hypothetical protein